MTFKLDTSEVQGISGMGGVGKTQLAVEYCHKYKEEYPGGVLWVRAEKSALEEYGTLGDELGLDLPETLEVRKQCEEVRRTLKELKEPGLLVLDNLDDEKDYETIKEYLPTTGHCRLLVTTRLNKLIAGDGIPLDVLNPDAALELLLKESGCENENGAGEGICEILGYLPLALELAGKYIGKTHTDLVKYLKRLEETDVLKHKSLDGKGKQGHVDHIASLKATLTVNKELLEDTEVQPVLAALTCFAPESINTEILGLVCDLEEENLGEVIGQLEDYSLIQIQADNRLSLHRLLRDALITQLPKKSINNARNSFIDKLMEWSKAHCSDVTKLKVIKPEAPHIIEATELADKLGIWPQSFDLAIYLGNYYYYLGRFKEMLKWLTFLESHLKEKHTEDKGRLSRLLNNIGLTYKTLGDYDKAIKHYEKSLPVTKEAYGKRHPEVAIRLSNQGETWRAKGEYDKAIDYFEQALSIMQEVYGEKHPNVSTCLNNLGGAWNNKGNHDKAIQYYEQALSIDKEYSGKRHPHVAYGLNNLGMAWVSKGENDKARDYYRQAYDIFLEFLGEDHPNTRTVKKNMEALPG